MKKKIVLQMPIRPYGRWLFLFDDRAAFAAYCNEFSGHEKARLELYYSETSQGSTCSCKHGDYIVGIFTGAADVDQTLVHELGHVVIRLMIAIGMDVNLETEEAFCYLQDYLFEVCRQALKLRRTGSKYVG